MAKYSMTVDSVSKECTVTKDGVAISACDANTTMYSFEDGSVCTYFSYASCDEDGNRTNTSVTFVKETEKTMGKSMASKAVLDQNKVATINLAKDAKKS